VLTTSVQGLLFLLRYSCIGEYQYIIDLFNMFNNAHTIVKYSSIFEYLCKLILALCFLL